MNVKSAISQTPYPDAAFAYFAKAEAEHWWFRCRNQLIIWILKSRASNLRDFLEVGCGTGYVISGIARAFPLLKLEATEYFENGLVFARQRLPSCSFRQLDAKAMVEAEAYDGIGSFDVIEHIDADQVVLDNLFRALRPGGLLLLTVPQHPWLWSATDVYAHHIRRYTRMDLCQKVKTAGFQIEYCSSFVCLLLPVMALQRILLRTRQFDPDSEFKINPLLNKFLYLVMQLEFALMMFGLRFPAGGSLLLVARKP